MLATQRSLVRSRGRLPKRGLRPFLLSIPFVAFILIFSYYPLYGWIYSVFDYSPGMPLSESPFVGLKYFIEMFKQWSQTSIILRNTIALSLFGILLSPIPVFFAVALNEVKATRFRKLVQTTTTLPNFISWIVIYGAVYALFSVGGMINKTLMDAHITNAATNFLGNSHIAWLFQVLLSLWKGLGWTAIIYIAAISGIDQELYSAAKVDGAGRFRCMMHVTIPGIAETYLIMLMLQVANMLSNGFDQYFIFNNPLVSSRLMVLDVYVYKVGIIYQQYSFAIAIGIWKTVISILLLCSVNLIAKKLRGDPIF